MRGFAQRLAGPGLFLALATPALASPATTLRLGTAESGSLSAGGRRELQLRTVAGMPYRLAVEQRGVDLVLELRTADGRAALRLDSPRGRFGSERALFEARRGERLTIELTAAAGAGSGRFEVLVTEAAAASTEELDFERAATEAGALFTAGTPQARKQALAAARRALALAGGRSEQAGLHHLMAVVSRQLNQPEDAAVSAREALRLWLELGDERGAALAANELGFVLWQRGEASAARVPLERALRGRRALSDAHGEAQTLINLALTHQSTGDLDHAGALLEEARGRARQAADPDLEAAVLNNLGGLHMARGAAERALPLFQDVVRLYPTPERRRERTQALLNLAAAERILGRPERALADSFAALELAREEGDQRLEGAVRNGIGLLHLAAGDARRARIFLASALPLRRSSADRRGEAATLDNLGQALARLDEPAGAELAYREALALRRATGDRRGEGTTLDHLGQLLAAGGDLAAARRTLEAALAVRSTLGDAGREARTRTHLAALEIRAGDLRRASELLALALAAHRRGADTVGLAETLATAAKAERRAGRPHEARARLEESVNLLESLRARFAGGESRATFLALKRESYDELLDLLLELGGREPGQNFVERALEASERLRARSLLDLLGEGAQDLAPAAEREALERVRARAAHHFELLSRGGREEEAQSVAAELDELLTELEARRAESARTPSAAPSLVRPRTATEIQSQLEPETLLLELALGSRQSHLFAVTRAGITVVPLPERRLLEHKARSLYAAWSTLDVGAAASEAEEALTLSRLLLSAVAPQLARARRLVVVADGAFHLLPFAALPHPTATPERAPAMALLTTHEVVHLPSASVLATLRTRAAQRPPPRLRAAILADPQFGPRAAGLGRLPASRREAEALASYLVPDERLLALGGEASRELLLSDRVAAAGILHLATHGWLDEERPALSGLALAQVDAQGRPADGWVRLADLAHLRLASDLVVLSGCRTALGRPLAGEGLLGLTQGFFEAGASRVVASLWQVRDRATATLMQHFYRVHLGEGRTPAEALRRAQLALSREARTRDPYFWAVFTLQGEWR